MGRYHEMGIKKSCTKTRDGEIHTDGFIDISEDAVSNSTLDEATNALVFLVVPLNWKLPIGN